jgi:hypothetical protein
VLFKVGGLVHVGQYRGPSVRLTDATVAPLLRPVSMGETNSCHDINGLQC